MSAALYGSCAINKQKLNNTFEFKNDESGKYGTVDWGFGPESFTWSLDEQGIAYVEYGSGTEQDKYTFTDVLRNDDGTVQSAQMMIFVDENMDNIYDTEEGPYTFTYTGPIISPVTTTQLNDQSFTLNHNDGSSPFAFSSLGTGSVDWGFGEETFTWSIDTEGRVLVVYDSGNEQDRYTFISIEEDGNSNIVSAEVILEVDHDLDDIYDETEGPFEFVNNTQ
ncbi:MAG: hypothetical protein HWE10_05615 [Gammaproteobacteria bacterium]|nr:hypothetical protein [Gammaproteobacteria bacterium]